MVCRRSLPSLVFTVYLHTAEYGGGEVPISRLPAALPTRKAMKRRCHREAPSGAWRSRRHGVSSIEIASLRSQ
jgi:hypothetical protein